MNRETTRAFLAQLNHSDYRIFCFHEGSDTLKNKGLRTFTTDVDDNLLDELESLNNDGYGVFITINKMIDRVEGRRKLSNFDSVVAAYMDFDGKENQVLPDHTPSLIVESSAGNYHYYYWLDKPSKDFSAFKGIQLSGIERYGADPKVSDVTRILRLPGSYNMKAEYEEPFLTRLLDPESKKPLKRDELEALRTNDRKEFTLSELKSQDFFPKLTKQKRDSLRHKENRDKKSREYDQKDVDSLEVALSYIDPDCIYDRWLKVLFGIHYVYLNTPDELFSESQAYALALKWSSGILYGKPSATYQRDGAEHVKRQWEAIDPSTDNPIRLNSIVAFAKEHPDYERFVQTNGYNLQIIGDPEKRSPEETELEQCLRHYAKVGFSGKIRFAKRTYSHTGEHYVFMTYQNLKDDLSSKFVHRPTPSNKDRMVPMADELYKSPKLPYFEANPQFSPEPNRYLSDYTDREIVDNYPPNTPCHLKSLNLFIGFTHKPQEDQVLLQRVLDLVYLGAAKQDPILADYIHNFAAMTVQRPDIKIPIMMTFVGSKGCGKSQLANIIRALVHPYNYKVNTFEDIIGKFAGPALENALCVQLEEAVWAGHNGDNSRLKDYITDTRQNIERKGLQAETKPVFFNMVATANPGRTMPEGSKADERRFLTMDFSNHLTKNKTFWDSLGENTDVAIPGTLRYRVIQAYKDFLLKRDISSFDPKALPDIKSDAASRNREESQHPCVQFLLTCTEEDELVQPADSMLQAKETTSLNKMFNEHPEYCLIQAKRLRQEFSTFVRQQSRYRQSDTAKIAVQLGRALTELTGNPNIVVSKILPRVQDLDDYPDHLTKGHRYIRIPSKLALEEIKEKYL